MWNLIASTPPDELVEVMDDNGNIFKSQPTYYPFIVGENKRGGRWGHDIIPCQPYWDGGWNTQISFDLPDIGKIVKWRLINKL